MSDMEPLSESEKIRGETVSGFRRMAYTCSICRMRVSQSQPLSFYYQRGDDGGFDHASCHTPEAEKLNAIFADHGLYPRGDVGQDQNVIRVAASIGHSISVGDTWHCICGLRGSIGPNRRQQMTDGYEHLQNVVRAGW